MGLRRSAKPGQFCQIIWDTDEITPAVKALPEKLDRGLAAIMEYQANPVQTYARTNATWTDQTGNARGGLTAEAFETGGGRDAQGRFVAAGASGSIKSRGIVIYHSVPYGLWLEVRFSGRYAIIVPTIEAKGPDVMRMVNKLLERAA